MFKKILTLTVIVCFFLTTLGPLPKAHADSVLGLPAPGTMVNLSPAYEPVIIKGLTVHKDNPFLFDFIVDIGQDRMSGEPLKKEGEKLIKYFLASLAIPDKDVWVNLSPYENNRMIPEALGQTDMGRDLLEQDYILKQITASLIYPEKQLGKTFWDKVYSKAQQMYGTTQVPVNTFNKVWIMADRAEVFEHNQTAFVVDSHLKVMLEEDYLALQKHSPGVIASEAKQSFSTSGIHSLGSQIVRQIILPQLEKEINTGKNFANLRQVFNSIILSNWYKKNLKQALLNQVYTDQSKIKGINLNDPTVKQQIYEQYLKAYKKGVFNYIKEDVNNTGKAIPRKYFSGGINEAMAATPVVTTDRYKLDAAMGSETKDGRLVELDTGMAHGTDTAMTQAEVERLRDMPQDELMGMLTQAREEERLARNQYAWSSARNLFDNIWRELVGNRKMPRSEIDALLAEQKYKRIFHDPVLKRLIAVDPSFPLALRRIYEILKESLPVANNSNEIVISTRFNAPYMEYYLNKLIKKGKLPFTVDLQAGTISIKGRKPESKITIKVIGEYSGPENWEELRNLISDDFEKASGFVKELNFKPEYLKELLAIQESVIDGTDAAMTSSDLEILSYPDGLNTFIKYPFGEGRKLTSIDTNVWRVQEDIRRMMVSNLRLNEWPPVAESLAWYLEVPVAKLSSLAGENRDKASRWLDRQAQIVGEYWKEIDLNVQNWTGSIDAFLQKYEKLNPHMPLQGRTIVYKTGRYDESVSFEDERIVIRQGNQQLVIGIPHPGITINDRSIEKSLRVQHVSFVGARIYLDITGDVDGSVNYFFQSMNLVRVRAHPVMTIAEAQDIYRSALTGYIDFIDEISYNNGEIIRNLRQEEDYVRIYKLDNLQKARGILVRTALQDRYKEPSKIKRLFYEVLEDVYVLQHFKHSNQKRNEYAGIDQTMGNIFNDSAMAVDFNKAVTTKPGGIDLNTQSINWKISKDGKGVEMNIDPAMIERVRREGIDSLSPVIFRITSITSIWPLVGLQAPVKNSTVG